MNISLESRLMPQYLPGSPARARWTQLEMAPAANGQALLWTLDADGQLTLWLPSQDSATPWYRVHPVLRGDRSPRLLHLALTHNSGQGRHDDTLDIAIVADVGDGVTPQRQWFVWNGATADTEPAIWTQRFQQAQPQDMGGLAPELSHWGQAPRRFRTRCLQGRRPDGRLALWWQRFDDTGQPLEQLVEEIAPTVPPDTVLTTACIAALDDQGVYREGYARNLVSESVREGQMTLVWPPTAEAPRRESAVTALDGSPIGWGPSEGLWPLTRNNDPTWVYFDTDRGDAGLITAAFTEPVAVATRASLEAAPVPGGVRALYRRGEVGGFVRLELVQTPEARQLLRLTESTDPFGENGRSTFLEADGDTFALCECEQPYGPTALPPLTVLHVLVGYAAGGLWLLSKDSVSGLWQRRMILDDDAARGLSQTPSQTTSVRVTDDSGAPVTDARVRLQVQAPCHAYLDGRSVHLSPVSDTVIDAGPTGAFTLIQPTPGFGVPLVDLEVVAANRPTQQATLNPMQRMVDRMRPVTTGQGLRDQVGSDGRQPFRDVPIERCDLTVARLQPMLRAYDGTLPRPTGRPAATRAVQRVVFQRDGAAVMPLVSDIDRAPTPDDALDDLGDMLAWLWSADAATGDFGLTFLDNGVAEVFLTIGDTLWTALIDQPDQAIDLIHWLLDDGLGVALNDLINWLGQVFDWDAILATHRTLGQLLALARQDVGRWLREEAPGAVAAQLAWARDNLARLPDLDPATRERLSRATTSGPGEPASASAAISGPDAQWGASTFANHVGASSVAAGGQWAAGPALAEVIASAEQTFASLISDLLAQLEKMDPSTTPLLTLIEDTVALSGAATIDALGALMEKILTLLAALIDDVWAQLGERIEIPVLTTLYEETIAPGSTASLLDLMLLSAAIAGDIGARVTTGQPLISPAFAQAVSEAPSLAALIAGTAGTTTASPWATDVQLAVTVVGFMCKGLYLACWTTQRALPPGTPVVPTLVYAKCGFDSAAWAVSTAWAYTRCLLANPPSELLRGSTIFLAIDGTISRTKDAIEVYYARQGQAPSRDLRLALAAIETVLGGVGLTACAVANSVNAALTPPVPPSDLTNWNFLKTMPLLQSFATAAYMAVSYPEMVFENLPQFRQARTGLNVIRTVIPALSAIGLSVAVRNDWQAPGNIAD